MPDLSSIRLTNIQVSDKKLVHFFLRHGKIIKSVRLEKIDVIATGGTLTHSLERMQRLLRLRITGEFRTESGKTMSLGLGLKKERPMQRSVENYLLKEEPCSYDLAGLEYGLSWKGWRGCN